MSSAILRGDLRAHPHLQQLVAHTTQLANDLTLGKTRLTSQVAPEILQSIKLEIASLDQAAIEGVILLLCGSAWMDMIGQAG